jgi:hypothetical protein
LASGAGSFARSGFSVLHRHPPLKGLEEWFEMQKGISVIAKLDPFFEKSQRLASWCLKRELVNPITFLAPALTTRVQIMRVLPFFLSSSAYNPKVVLQQ